MSSIVVTGANSGLGRAITEVMVGDNVVYGWDKNVDNLVDDVYPLPYDLSSKESIEDAVWSIESCNILINCVGVNEINWLADLAIDDWERTMNINARAIYLISQALLPELIESKGTILNIISNASHMPMTASLAYNASKGAAHIMTLQMARELTPKYGITVFGVSPNKMAGTEMSKYIDSRVPEVRGWTQEEASAYQQKSLLVGEETPPERVAEFIAFLLYRKENHKYLSGCVLPYGA